MVIDDEANVRSAMAELLSQWGCEVLLASSIAQALDVAGASRPECVVADYRLHHGESGIRAIEVLRERFGRVPALLVTGDTSPKRLREAAASGLALLHKPVAADSFKNVLARTIKVQAIGAIAHHSSVHHTEEDGLDGNA
jgi:DNA-binding NtrC family response regulator